MFSLHADILSFYSTHFFSFFLFARRSLVVRTEIILLIDFSGVGTPKNWARPFFVSVILTGKQLIEEKFTPPMLPWLCDVSPPCDAEDFLSLVTGHFPPFFGGGGVETCKEPKRIGANGVETG